MRIQGSPNPVTLQLILFEGSNNIAFQYQTITLAGGNPASNGGSATIGIRNTGGVSNGQQIQWSFDAAVLANGTALVFSPGSGGATSVNTITTNPVGLTVSVDGVSATAPVQVSWTPGTSHTLSVASAQSNNGVINTFTSWSTSATTTQITVQAASPGTTYTANFSTAFVLTTGVNPTGGGTVSGAGPYSPGSAVSLTATAASGFVFDHFSGDFSSTSNPLNISMNAPHNVVANFRSSASPALTATITNKTNGSTSGTRVWTISLANSGLGTALNTQITGITFTQSGGTACDPVAVISTPPIAAGTIAPSSSASAQVTLNFGSCLATARFTVQFNFSANGGSLQGPPLSSINSIRKQRKCDPFSPKSF